ncbi:DUF2180 family protein [Streptomyces coriariae]|uniref:DUF2180 family protein n=1 Tax=Streptomyces TaxID=1883 RepID=UPI0011507873|nr:LSD1 subclass zinc finger protein [Streptomyces sp. SLBN-115]
MHCLDCRIQGTKHTAVAVCHDCGAAACAEHVRVTVNEVHGRSMLSAPYQPSARTVRCATCATARAA